MKNNKKPSMNELINWFLINHTNLANEMKNSYHELHGNKPNPYHIEGDVFCHTMLVCQQAELDNASTINKICALLHDVGKPKARQLSQDKSKVRFIGHEGLSFYLSIKPLNDLVKLGVINKDELEKCLRIISMHGQLFDFIDENGNMKNQNKVFSKFLSTEVELFNMFILQVKYDSTGRFFTSKDGRKNFASELGNTIYTQEQFIEYHKSNKTKLDLTKPTLELLVGVPGVGKSTYLENKNDAKIISRDNILLDYARTHKNEKSFVKCNKCDNGIVLEKNKVNKYKTTYKKLSNCTSCNNGLIETKLNYSDAWKLLTDKDQNEIDRLVEKEYQKAFKDKEDVTIDMTNVSAKSRRKWINKFRGYNTKVIVFLTDFDTIFNRATKRGEESGKDIPKQVIINMMKSFTVPDYTNIIEMEFA